MKKLYNFPKLVIVIITLITLAFASQLPKIVIDNDVKIFLPNGHPARVNDDNASATFGSSDVILLGIEFKKDGILTPEHIKLVDSLTKSFENLNHVHKVQSLTNTDFIKGTTEGMEVENIVKTLPETKEDIALIREQLLDWKTMYKKSLYTDDFKATSILIQFDNGSTAVDQEDVFHEIRDILKDNSNDKNVKYHLAGQPVLNTLMGESMQIDMKKLIPFVLLIVIGSLYLSFRTVGGVVLPLLTVIISTIWSLGLMAGMKIPLTMVSTIIPVLLIAVGSAYGIHIISHYYDDLKKHPGEISEEDHKKLVLHNVEKVGTAVFLAALTTIAGFGSLATSKIVPIKNFGLFTALGVFGALIVALTLIPCILLLKKPKLSNVVEEEEETLMTTIMMGAYHFFTKRRSAILILTILVFGFSIYGTSKVVIDSIIVQFFKEDTTVRKADEYLNKNFNGSNFINVVISGTEKGDMTNPEILKDIDDMKAHFMSNHEQVGNVVTFADFIKRMNKAMNFPTEETGELSDDTTTSDEVYDDSFDDGFDDSDSFDDSFDDFGDDDNVADSPVTPKTEIVKLSPKTENISEADMIKVLNNAILDAKRLNLSAEELVENINKATNYQGEAYNEIPYDPAKYPAENREDLKNLISQYLLLYSGELDSFTDDTLEPKSTRVVFQLKTASNIFISDLKSEIQDYASENFPDGYTVTISGAGDMSLAVNDLIVSSQIWSIISSLIIVLVIVAFSFRSIVAGIFGIIPLILSLFINFGIMGFAGIKLDVGTAMVASIAIGIGVDYTIHFLSAYKFERLKTDDLEIVTKKTLSSSGKAIIFNAASVAFGFAVLVFSNFNPIKDLGLLICITMVTSSMGSMILLPILLNIFKPKFISKTK